jgi:outer membrane protein OmpA-like peptidoglycan-associated protein
MKTRRKCTLSFFLTLGMLANTGANASGSVSSYYADIDRAIWQVESSVFECRLLQQIPELGLAVFYHEAGESLSFYLQANDNPMQAGRALLTSVPPVWRKDLPVRDLGYVDVATTNRPVNLDASRSRLILAELERGMVPTLMRRAWYSEDESVHVGISPVNFGEAYQQYNECTSQLLPVNFGQIERSSVFWRSGQRELDDAIRAQLDVLVTYLKADLRVYQLEINGFTDGSGNPRDNLEFSRLRAFAVHEYLVSQGIDESRLATRFFGSTPEFRIIADERTAADRDRNRRVTIRLIRN